MRSILGSLHLASAQLIPLSAREQDPGLDERVARLDQSYYRLLRLVNNLSMAVRLTDSPPLPLQDRDVVALVGGLCRRAESLAAMLHLELRFVCPMEYHICAINSDALDQIVSHLLSNAFKFTPAGGTITVDLRLQHGKVLLSVEDTGCGIADEHLSTLFEDYLRDDSMAPAPHGLGLGLALCRALAKSHGGALVAHSWPGKGSRFVLSLPDQQIGCGVSDIPFDYGGGFNHTLLAFADALPTEAFLVRSQH